MKYVKGEENLSLRILKGLLLNASKKHALWQYYLHVNSVKGYTKMARRPPFLPIYSYEADNEKGTTFQWKIHERDTFVKNSIYKGKGLDLGAKPLRAKLY